MKFRTRNAYYLRISSDKVLPLYLYLDERHIDWMSDRILQYVLQDLRPLIIPKLQAEANAHLGPGAPQNAKKGTVDVKRGDSYQFAYFLRKTEGHSVIIKTRTFTAMAPQPKGNAPPLSLKESRTRKGKRKPNDRTEHPGRGRKKRKTKGKGRARVEDSEEELSISSGESSDDFTPDSTRGNKEAPRRSGRARKPITAQEDGPENEKDPILGTSEDVEMIPDMSLEPSESDNHEIDMPVMEGQIEEPVVKEEDDQDITVTGPSIDLDIDDEEEDKPKLLLQLKYQGFNISGNCLCVVVEPWPSIRASSRAPSIAPIFSNTPRAQSIAPPNFSSSAETTYRERTPLFLPDPDRGRSETPAPVLQGRVLPPVPLFNDTIDQEIEDSDDDGLMEFSQVLNSAGEHRAGLVDEDDEMDGAVFFGDADEAKEF